ncbi:MAG: AarF/ABC1/UbiB kinase family protein [Myxococcota bacterium]|nr:AarF/ABC1/UbiB kinase family protein [Myxococcota bacterium]
MSGDEFRTGRLARFGKLGAAVLGASSRYLGDRVADAVRQADQRQQAQSERLAAAGARLASTMGELKGAAMKLGQMLSVDNEVLPEEMRNALSVLQRQAPPMPFTQVRRLVAERLGQPLDELFEHFDDEVLGAASLGQVHAATLRDGRRVAVKIQYPGIAGTIRSDMANLRALLKVTPLPGLKDRVDEYIEEISEAFTIEADYLREAEHQLTFGAIVATLDGVVVPQPVMELCRSDLLVMDRLDGVVLKDAWATLDQDQRNQVGHRFVEFFSQTFHCHQWVYGDPHPGNFLYLNTGELGVLDFGCARRTSAERTDNYLRLLQALWAEDGQALLELYQSLDFARGEAVLSPEALLRFNQIALAPFVGEGPFDWGAWSFRDDFQRFLLKHPEFLKFTPDSQDLLYLRMVSGLRGMMHDGRVVIDVRSPAERLIAERFS